MIKAIISDISYTFLFPKDSNYGGTLNGFHDQLSKGEFDFFKHFYLEESTIDKYNQLKNKFQLVVCTSGDIQKDPQILPIIESTFQHIFSASDLGLRKSEPSIYQHIIQSLNIKPEEAVFIDDLARNIEAAASIGLQTHHYTSQEKLLEFLDNLK